MNPSIFQLIQRSLITVSTLHMATIAAHYMKLHIGLLLEEKRRLLEDFGYWYAPDGRSEAQQREFEKVEVKPQAIEWILADAAGFRYFASSDNLSGKPGDTQPFKNNVYQQVLHYIKHGLPERAEKLRQALAVFYGTPLELSSKRFDVTRI